MPYQKDIDVLSIYTDKSRKVGDVKLRCLKTMLQFLFVYIICVYCINFKNYLFNSVIKSYMQTNMTFGGY